MALRVEHEAGVDSACALEVDIVVGRDLGAGGGEGEGNEERVPAENRRVLTLEVLRENEVALVVGRKELRPRAPDSAGGVGDRTDDAGGHGQSVRIEELARPVLAVLR